MQIWTLDLLCPSCRVWLYMLALMNTKTALVALLFSCFFFISSRVSHVMWSRGLTFTEVQLFITCCCHLRFIADTWKYEPRRARQSLVINRRSCRGKTLALNGSMSHGQKDIQLTLNISIYEAPWNLKPALATGYKTYRCPWNENIGISTLLYSHFQWIIGKVILR